MKHDLAKKNKAKKTDKKPDKKPELSKAIVKKTKKPINKPLVPETGQFTRTKRAISDIWSAKCKQENMDPNKIRFSREFIQAIRAINEDKLNKKYEAVAMMCRMMGKQTFGLKEAHVFILMQEDLTSAKHFLNEPTDRAAAITKLFMDNIKFSHSKENNAEVDSEDVSEFKKSIQNLFADQYECAANLDKFLKLSGN